MNKLNRLCFCLHIWKIKVSQRHNNICSFYFTTKRINSDMVALQIFVLYLWNPIPFGSIMTSSFVWNQVLLVCPFVSGTGELRVDVLKFWFQHITCDLLPSCIYGVLLCFIDNLWIRYHKYASSVPYVHKKSTKRTNPVSPLKISISIGVY